MTLKNVWEMNKQWLQKNMPAVAVKLNGIDKEIQVSTIETKYGWNVRISKKDFFSFLLHSLYNREREYRGISRNIQPGYRTLVIVGCVGMDFLHYIADNYLNIKHIILVEPHVEVFRAFLERWSIVEAFGIFSKVSLIIGEKEDTVKDWLKQALATGMLEDKTVALIGTHNYRWNFSNYFACVESAVVESIRFSRVNHNTMQAFRNFWLLNTWHNLQYGDAYMEDFKEEFQGKPAIIVSAGPSLDKNIHLLQKASEKALIVAVGSAMTILEARGIKPHFRIAIDPGEANEKLFSVLNTNEIPLLYSEHLFYSILPQYAGAKVQLNLAGNSAIISHLHQCSKISRDTISSGFSVANVAASLLAYWQCNPIVFVGQDLAYTEERLHAKGAWDSETEAKHIRRHYLRKDIFGQDVYTDAPFEGMRQIFERIISMHPQLQFFNATEGGIAIQGAPNRELRELLNEWEGAPHSYKEAISGKIVELKNNGISKKRINVLQEGALVFQKEMEEYLGKIEQSKRLGRRLLKKGQPLSGKEAKQIVRSIEKLQKEPMDVVLGPIFEEAFRMRREGYFRQQRENKTMISHAQLFFLELCEKEEYVKRFLQVIGWYINGEEFKVVVQE